MSARHLLFVPLVSTIMFANAQQSTHDGEYNPWMEYAFLREADAIWCKRVWRMIGLDEKLNLPLKFPPSGSESERKNLFDVLMDAIEKGSLTAYSYTDDHFTVPMSMEEILARGGARDEVVTIQQSEPPYLPIDTIIPREFSRDKVIGYRIKEDWFFDKQRSVMEARIIGISPVIYAEDETGLIREGNLILPLFWIYFPAARKVLANAKVFIRENEATERNFDDVFTMRLFGSFIFKESNVFDRRISDYTQGISALLESERIKESITYFEHDMWEY